MSDIRGIIDDAATSSGLDADYLARIARIESGMNPNARTGSYHGLFQLSPTEFQRYGGRNIYDPADNARTAAAMMADQRQEFTAKYGRPPTPTEAYMVHQQGAAGLDAHLTNPDAPAWQNMASTGEGRQKGAGWAKQAIWGNIPDYLKPQFGSVENVTSNDFINKVWAPKVEGDNSPPSGSPAGLPVQADDMPATGSPAGLPGGVPGDATAVASASPGSLGMLDPSNLSQRYAKFGPGMGILNSGQQQAADDTPSLPPMRLGQSPIAQAMRQQLLASLVKRG